MCVASDSAGEAAPTGGERRCPPEDCGGVPGYFEFLKNVLSKQKRLRDAGSIRRLHEPTGQH